MLLDLRDEDPGDLSPLPTGQCRAERVSFWSKSRIWLNILGDLDYRASGHVSPLPLSEEAEKVTEPHLKVVVPSLLLH